MDDSTFSLRGKCIVVVGAAGLIGRTLSRSLNERGAKVVLVDILAPNLVEILGKDYSSSTALSCKIDVSNSSEVGGLLEQTLKVFGSVDVLINGHHAKPMGFLEAEPEDFPEELWNQVVDTNLKGTFLLCKIFGKEMLKSAKGSIINIASTYGVVSSNPSLYEENSMGNPLAYSASKGGIIMLTKYLGVYWAKRGVRVNCVTPHGVYNHHEKGFVDRFNKLSPMGRMMSAQELIGAVVYLASDASSYVTGSNLLVEGGWTAW